MPGFLGPRKVVPLLLIPEYSGINKGQSIPDSKNKPISSYMVLTIGYIDIGFPGGSVSKESTHNAGDLDSIPG